MSASSSSTYNPAATYALRLSCCTTTMALSFNAWTQIGISDASIFMTISGNSFSICCSTDFSRTRRKQVVFALIVNLHLILRWRMSGSYSSELSSSSSLSASSELLRLARLRFLCLSFCSLCLERKQMSRMPRASPSPLSK